MKNDRKSSVIISDPSEAEVKKYLDKWESLDKYKRQEESLDLLFKDTFRDNTDIHAILLKASVLNTFYSTNIFDVDKVARHIYDLKIDDRLSKSDEKLVNDIAKVDVGNKTMDFYSFASKYCSHHKPEDYPIYDDYVKSILSYFKTRDRFTKTLVKDFRDYKNFKSTIKDFQEYYGLKQFNLKEVDRYLWQVGKENFPKQYGRKSDKNKTM